MNACCEMAAMFNQVCLDCQPRLRRPKAPQDCGTLDLFPELPKEKTTVKNLCAKTVTRENAYEIWTARGTAGYWTWYVLKKWQADDNKPYARWFCDVVTPICPNGEMGDVYVSEIKSNAVRIK